MRDPNYNYTTWTPNEFFDKYMALLTAEEFKVLMYAVRRTYGFQKCQDRISVSQFGEGLIRKDGTHLDMGTGLNPRTVKKALKVLVQVGLLEKLESGSPDRTATLYELKRDFSDNNNAFLESRKVLRKANNEKRTSKARKFKEQGYATTPVQGYATTPVQGYATTHTKERERKNKISYANYVREKHSLPYGNAIFLRKIVIPNLFAMLQRTYEPNYENLEWIELENERRTSPFYGRFK